MVQQKLHQIAPPYRILSLDCHHNQVYNTQLAAVGR